ncbi:MAG: flagellar hook-basal body complex protein [Oscillospiraceae bacterium]|nr:flagellar hook-basal body complex protein [Oscillospiraceae bacterium]
MRDNPSFSVNEAADVAVREDLYTIPRTLNEQIGVPVTDRVYPIQLPRDSVGNLIPLDNISVGADGKISGRAANGLIIEIGMIALANVPNPEALEMTNNSYYKAKMNTGEISAVLPGEETSGSLEAGGLEMSNVDLTKEFTDMITTQRGFQANSRIITVTDEMLLELVNMKR